MFLTRISVDNPVFATMMMAALLVIGLFSYRQLGIDQFPNIDFPMVVVTTTYPGASPETVESDVTRKIEDAINTVSGVDTLTSRSLDGQSVVTIQFNLSTNSNVAAQDVREKVSAIRAQFRKEVNEPTITRFNPDDAPIISIAVESKSLKLRELTTLADQVIAKRLQAVRGAGKATIVGGVKRQIEIRLKPDRLLALNMGVDQVISAVRAENQDLPAGNITRGREDRVVQIQGLAKDPREFLNLIVAQRGATPVRLSEVADVVDGQQEIENLALVDGKPVLVIDVVKVQGANTIDVADGVRKAVAALQKGGLPADVRLSVVRDSSQGIRNSVNDVQATMIEGGVLTVLIVFLFLHSWRSTVITGLTLPIAVIGTFAVLQALGFTLNVMSLMALSLAIGILIDDAIVVRENIARHLAMGVEHRQASLDGTNEIGLAVLATTFSIVAVFIPVAFMGGIIGRFFFQFGMTVSAAVLISLFVSFTLDPMLSSVWHDPSIGRAPKGLPGRVVRFMDGALEAVHKVYRPALCWCLSHRLVVLGGTVGIFLASFLLVPLIGVEFVPAADLGETSVTVTAPVGSSLAYTQTKVEQAEAALREFPEVEYTYSTINTGSSIGKNVASIYVRLKGIKLRKRSPDQLAAPFRARLSSIPGIEVSIGIPGLGGGSNKPIQVSIQGPRIDELDRLSQATLAQMRMVKGLVDIDSSLKAARPTLDVRINRALASDLGISLQQVSDALRPLLTGEDASSWKDIDGQTYVVNVRLPVEGRATRADLARLFLASKQNGDDGSPRMVPLSQIAELTPGVGHSQINRRDLFREVLLTANVAGRPAGDASTDLTKALSTMQLPPGYRFVLGGSTKDIAETTGYAGSALLMAVIFIYLILASQFGSFLQPLAIMVSLPLSLIGVFLGLLAWGSTLNIFSAIGFIMLMGLVVKNAILLVDFINQARAAGMERDEAILEAGEIRLRPILMTTLAMVFGMLPMALGIGEGASQRAPMAHAVIGGLISSTLLTLVVVPVILTLFDDLARWLGFAPTGAQPSVSPNGVASDWPSRPAAENS
jgi:hydrophobic/amphiphilic exporter-1 (mainly G- bacteria), HAE1 family